MPFDIIDRRKNDKGKSTDNRQRFVKRVKSQIRDAVKDLIRKGNIKDLISNKGKKIVIPGKGLDKPEFNHTSGGITDRVFPGNKEYTQGKRISRPPEGEGGKGKQASNSDETGEDGFAFSLTKEEFLEFFFDDLELPDLVKKEIAKLDEFVIKRAGFSVDGSPSRLNITRSVKMAKGRRSALRTPKKKKIKALETKLQHLTSIDPEKLNVVEQEALPKEIEHVRQEIADLKRKLKAIPYIDDVDLRYNRWDKFPNPTTQAVMFGIMDVSGSMGEWEKEMAKRFFILLLLFLQYNYERVDIVWIKHHTEASEVSEDEFFYSQETGGTLVSPALELMDKIVQDRYPPQHWNVFACQISDGDNWSQDNNVAVDILDKSILNYARYFSYIEINKHPERKSDLWPSYETLRVVRKNMEMAVITGPEKIYSVFRSLFEKRQK